jgi:uncharacterized protein YajQ (UPF0234 family)
MKNLFKEFSNQIKSAATELTQQFSFKEFKAQFSFKEFHDAFFYVKKQQRRIKIRSTFDSRSGKQTIYNEKR